MVNKWEIYFCSLDSTIGSEQRGSRPVLVISNDAVNHNLPVVTILPISSIKEGGSIYPTEILLPMEISQLPRPAVVMLQQIRTISDQRLVKRVGIIDDENYRRKINENLKRYFEI